MTITITVTGETTSAVLEELRVLLQSTAAVAPASPVIVAEAEATTKRTRKSSAPKDVIEGEATVVEVSPPPPAPPPPPPPPPPPAEPTATLADLRAEATRIMQTEDTDFVERQTVVMATIKRVAGVNKFNEVPTDKFDELYAALKAVV
jgi:hypothetical protein